MHLKRNAGILLHISSLPLPYGIGDLGNEAYKFADFLNRCSQRYWQILPLTPIDSAQSFSPYSSVSSMAGNVWLINPDRLYEEGYLAKDDLTAIKADSDKVKNEKEFQLKSILFTKDFKNIK